MPTKPYTTAGFDYNTSRVSDDLDTIKNNFEHIQSVIIETNTPPAQAVEGQIYLDANAKDFLRYNSTTGTWERFTYSYLNGVNFKNKIINGDFSIWQRGTSFTGVGYTVDRWRYDTDTDDTVSITQKTTTGTEPFNSQYFVNISLTAGTTGTYNKFSTRLEFPKLYFGKTYTLSFYAKSDVAASITTKLAFVFSGTEYNPVSKSVNIGTTWQRYTITFTLGTPTGFTESGSDYLDVTFLLPVLTNVSIEIAEVQLEEGNVATDFEYVPYDIQLLRCMRYYRVFDKVRCVRVSSSGNYGGQAPPHIYIGDMRATPTLTATLIEDPYARGQYTAAVTDLNNGFIIPHNDNLVNVGDWTSHIITADAEL